MWPSTDFIPPLPPLKRRISGRLTIKRRRDASEWMGKHTILKAGKKVSCSICKEKGQKKATCSQVIGGGDDEVMVDARDALEMSSQDEQVVGVNGRGEGVMANARLCQIHHAEPSNKRKKSERIIKMKLAKKVGGEGSSPAEAMELD
ncbi:unnamed protein product [Lactuca virosa]|uniref:Uncharacterized protein n=1 Tax=Lactuca virosa TaxID=75947 RepID=A0AAU9MIX8_9ASTR|nr:unnamed protein product [Lactuca virosa]